jgi:hypothetical protein
MQFWNHIYGNKNKGKTNNQKGREKREEENVPYVMKPFFPTKFPWMFNFIVWYREIQ